VTDKADAICLAEILYQVRCTKALLQVRGTSKTVLEAHLRYAETAAEQILEHAGIDPGRTPSDADTLKMTLLRKKSE
jgi:hypothetical protein